MKALVIYESMFGNTERIAEAAFDTRIHTPVPSGSAAHRANRRLRRLGGRTVARPETFWVTGTTGPGSGRPGPLRGPDRPRR